MRHSEILAKFLKLFPSYANEVVRWAPAGLKSIKLKMADGRGLIFAYTNEYVWTLEGVGYYRAGRD